MPLPPALSPEQRQAALAKAAAARRQRADIKEQLKTGSLSLKALLAKADGDDALADAVAGRWTLASAVPAAAAKLIVGDASDGARP